MRKNCIKRVMIGLYVAFFLASGCMETLAAPVSWVSSSAVGIDGRKELYINAGKDRDLFRNFKDLMPGDTVEDSASLKNDSSMELTFYLRAYSDYVGQGDGAVRADGTSDKVVTAEGKSFKADLLDIIQLTLQSNGETIYSGPASGEGDLVSGDYGVTLGILPPGTTLDLKIIMELPGKEMTNEYANAFGAIDWQFIVESTDSGGDGSSGGDDSSGGGGSGGGDSSGGGGSGDGNQQVVVETIDEGAIPLGTLFGDDNAMEPVTVLITDGNVPLAGLAKTGGAVLYLEQVLFLLILLTIALIAVDRVRKHAGKRK